MQIFFFGLGIKISVQSKHEFKRKLLGQWKSFKKASWISRNWSVQQGQNCREALIVRISQYLIPNIACPLDDWSFIQNEASWSNCC
jgi:hypothetical protein